MADVADTLAEWSSTTDSNAPSGATNIGTSLDNNLREIQGVVVRGLSHKGSDIASSTTPALGAVEGLFHDITGTATITGFDTVRAGIWKFVKFEGALTLTHNATSLILPGGASITTADGDSAIFASEGSGNWRCHNYSKATGFPKVPTRQVFTSGSGTYTTPTGAVRLFVRMVGGGGGGAGATANNGTVGNDTTFSTFTASGGAGGTTNAGAGVAGGAAAGGTINIPGGAGQGGDTSGGTTQGGQGGSTAFGGGGYGGGSSQGGGNGATNSGGGGGGGSDATGVSGGGGGGGGYVEGYISSPAATYSYAVGAAANGGSAGGQAGGNGAAGIIIVEEFYI